VTWNKIKEPRSIRKEAAFASSTHSEWDVRHFICENRTRFAIRTVGNKINGCLSSYSSKQDILVPRRTGRSR